MPVNIPVMAQPVSAVPTSALPVPIVPEPESEQDKQQTVQVPLMSLSRNWQRKPTRLYHNHAGTVSG